MGTKKSLSDYQKEYAYEIDNQAVSYTELEKWGVSNEALSCEVLLRKMYGDEIAISTVDEDFNTAQKTAVSKLNETEIGVDQELRNIYERIEQSEFDANVEVLLKKLGDV